MELETTILSEVSQTLKDKYYMSSFTCSKKECGCYIIWYVDICEHCLYCFLELCNWHDICFFPHFMIFVWNSKLCDISVSASTYLVFVFTWCVFNSQTFQMLWFSYIFYIYCTIRFIEWAILKTVSS